MLLITVNYAFIVECGGTWCIIRGLRINNCHVPLYMSVYSVSVTTVVIVYGKNVFFL